MLGNELRHAHRLAVEGNPELERRRLRGALQTLRQSRGTRWERLSLPKHPRFLRQPKCNTRANPQTVGLGLDLPCVLA